MTQTPMLHQSYFRGFGSLFQRRFLRSLVSTTLGTSGILSLLIWLVQSLRYCGMMAYQGLSFSDVFYLSCHLLPRTVVMGTSWGFVVAIVWVYRRWSDDHALDIMRSCGMSSWFFNQPTIALALVLTGCLYPLTLHWGPKTAQISAAYERRIQGRFDPSFITSGVFFSIQGRTLYVHSQPSRYHLKGVFLHDYRDPNNAFILCGQSAFITPHEQGFRMRFQNGSMHVFPLQAPPYLAHFKSYTLNYTAPLTGIHTVLPTKAEAQSLSTLWRHGRWFASEGSAERVCLPPPRDDAASSDLKQPCAKSIAASKIMAQKELNYRLFWPTLPLLDALWIPPIVLYGGSLAWPLFAVLLILHGGMMSPMAGILLVCALFGRWVFWIYTRKIL